MKRIIGFLALLLSPLAVWAASVTGGNCVYTSLSFDASGNVVVTCRGTVPPVAPPTTPTTPTPPPPTTPPSTCPTPQQGYVPIALGINSPATEVRMGSGVIASYPIPIPNGNKVSIKLTQGQQQATPGDGTSEMSISKCPGVIDKTNPHCYSNQPNGLNFTVSKDAFTKAIYSFTDQASLGWRGCWAPASEGQWYVNVRWTYSHDCWGGACGYTMQWGTGAY